MFIYVKYIQLVLLSTPDSIRKLTFEIKKMNEFA
jgi:hypothetical protein